MKLTFVIPVLNEQETLAPLVEGIMASAAPHSYRILFIDDGSTDGSFAEICRLRERHPCVDVIRFRRNFGKSAALASGFAHATGEVVMTLDADLQDDPREIPRFLEKLDEGFDVVSGWKQVRHDPWHKTFPSQVFNRIIARLFGLDLHDINCGFKAYRAEVVKNIQLYGERHRLIPVLASNLGYRVAEIPVEHHPRRHGRSKYGFERFARGAMDALSAWFLSRYMHSPGHFFGALGLLGIALGLACLAAANVAWIVFEASLVGIEGVIIGASILIGGMLSICVGLVAELAVRQHSPASQASYIVEERIGD